MPQYGFCKIIELLFEKLLTKWGFCGIICFVKICETNLLGLRLIRADARPVDLDFRDESLFECAAKPISLIIIYRYTKRPTEPTVFRNAEKCAETGAYHRNRGDSCRPCVREGGARSVTEGLLVWVSDNPSVGKPIENWKWKVENWGNGFQLKLCALIEVAAVLLPSLCKERWRTKCDGRGVSCREPVSRKPIFTDRNVLLQINSTFLSH